MKLKLARTTLKAKPKTRLSYKK